MSSSCHQIMSLTISLLKYGKLAFKLSIIHFSSRKKSLSINFSDQTFDQRNRTFERTIVEMSFVMQAYIIKASLLLCRPRCICFKENKQVKPTKCLLYRHVLWANWNQTFVFDCSSKLFVDKAVFSQKSVNEPPYNSSRFFCNHDNFFFRSANVLFKELTLTVPNIGSEEVAKDMCKVSVPTAVI